MISIRKTDKVLFIGDSITDVKFNAKFMHKIKGRSVYALQMKKYLKKYSRDIKVEIKGIASNRTYHVYDRLTKDCISLKPDVIVMLIGVNDAWENYTPESYPPLVRPMEPHLREIYRRISTELPDAKVICLLPFLIDSVEEKLPFHKTLDEFRELIKSIATEHNAEIIDLQKIFNEKQKSVKPEILAIDGIHPTNTGHKVIAGAIKEVFEFC